MGSQNYWMVHTGLSSWTITSSSPDPKLPKQIHKMLQNAATGTSKDPGSRHIHIHKISFLSKASFHPSLQALLQQPMPGSSCQTVPKTDKCFFRHFYIISVFLRLVIRKFVKPIESSFRKLKYTIGISNFHAYKPESIKQEIWAKLTAYNVTETLVSQTVIEKKQRKHAYKVNFSRAPHICRKFLYPP